MTQSFSEAFQRLVALLKREGWPEPVAWVAPEHVLSFPSISAVLHPGIAGASPEPEPLFEAARASALPIELYGVGSLGNVSYAFVRPIRDLGQGEHMFLERNVKVSIAANPPRIVVVRTRLRWWVLSLRHRLWLRRRDHALKSAT